MKENKSIINQNFLETFFVLFIVVQPFLDLVAYFGTELSLVIRVLAMLVGFIYLCIYPNMRVKKYTVIYILLLGGFMIINTANNYMMKNPFNLIQELTYGVKTIYVMEMLLLYTVIFHSIKNRMTWEKVIQRSLFINMSVIGIIMLLATLFDSGKRSYGTLVKKGHSGWFYSANDLSAILALGFGIMLLYLIQMKNIKTKLLLLPFLFLVIWSMLTVGTKVGLGALAIGLFTALLITGIRQFLGKGQWVNITIVVITMIIAVIYIPYSAIGNNIGLTFFNQTENVVSDSEGENSISNDSISSDPNLTYKVMSGRELFLANAISDYKGASFSQKLLGMGPGGNYEESLKIIEMDFLDWLFGYGIIGFILLILPFFYYGFMIVNGLFQYRLLIINPSFFMVGQGVVLGLGIAFFAGHILLNPASGIYFAILLGYLYTLSKNNPLV